MCHRRVLLAGGSPELCRTALAVEIASIGYGLANSEMVEADVSSCCSLLPVKHSSFPCVAPALLMQKVTDLSAL